MDTEIVKQAIKRHETIDAPVSLETIIVSRLESGDHAPNGTEELLAWLLILCRQVNRLQADKARLRALLERLAAYGEPVTSVVWEISTYADSPKSSPLYLGSAGQGDDADVFDVVADIGKAMRDAED